jgi:chromosome segregation and condensation protein ScpB
MRDLLKTLDLVHEAAVRGNLAALPSLTTALSELMQTGADGLTEKDLAVVGRKAARNAALLNAAMQGMRAAQRRLVELREAASGHRTYSRSGDRPVVAQQPMILKLRV